jgi:hypothetical protein
VGFIWAITKSYYHDILANEIDLFFFFWLGTPNIMVIGNSIEVWPDRDSDTEFVGPTCRLSQVRSTPSMDRLGLPPTHCLFGPFAPSLATVENQNVTLPLLSLHKNKQGLQNFNETISNSS